MHHFFADPTQVAEDTIFITGPDVNHMKHVLRMKPGEEVLISDGTGTQGKSYCVWRLLPL